MLNETDVKASTTRFPLTTKQQAFFQRHRQFALEIQAAMMGALRLIMEENDIKGNGTVSEDGTEVIVTPLENAANPQQGLNAGA
jgi:hypothetical protein